MRWYGLVIVASLLGLTANGHLVGPAFAVMDEPPPAPAPQLAPTAVVSSGAQTVMRLDIPVNWQLTRTRLLGPGATTLTESFKETWTLEVRPGGVMYMHSPRANVPVYPTGAETATSVPKTVVVGERDFARLVGVAPEGGGESEEPDTVASAGRPVTINLGKTTKNSDINLAWSEEEHYAVHIDVGNTTTLF